MRENGHIARHDQIEKEILQLWRCRMVRRFHQHVARIGDRKQAAGAQTGNKIGAHMNIRTGHEAKRDAFRIERGLKFRDRLPDPGAGIMIKAGEDVGRARHHFHALIHRHFRHLQRHGQVAGAVVQPCQHVAMKVDHSLQTNGGEIAPPNALACPRRKRFSGPIFARISPILWLECHRDRRMCEAGCEKRLQVVTYHAN